MKVPASDTSTATFSAALDALVAQLRGDRSILAAILGGSLSHDTVWAKSDIDLLLVTVDDTLAGPADIALYANGVNVHALLMQRAAFRKLAEGAVHQSFMHSFLAKSRVLFTHDDTIADLCRRLQTIGERDTHLALLRAATERTAADLQGTQVPGDQGRPGLHRAVDSLRGDAAGADRGDRRPASSSTARSSRRRWRSTPAFFRTVYSDLLNAKKTRKSVEARADGGRRLHRDARAAGCSRRCSTTCAKLARSARRARSRVTSRVPSASNA